MKVLGITLVVLLTLLVARSPAADSEEEVAPAELERYEKFGKMMSGVKLSGQFTVLGREQAALPKDEYTIMSVKKRPKGDYWTINARIQYGQYDLTVPLPLEVKWAGDTPVITLTDFTIPGLGTFSSRVLIYNKKYAGTWTHGKVGGHMFGTVEKLQEEKETGENR